jgi:hypothetical protein
MAESAADLYARVVAQVGEGGRLPTPSVAGWEIFPWQAEDGTVVVKPLAPPAPEEPRHGEAGVDCRACGPQVEGVIWRDDVWRVRHLSERSGLPLVLFLEPYEHVDFGALDEGQAAQFGTLSVRLARIVESLPNIARCHVMRVGDGAEHLHIWFMGRTEGLLQARGSCAVDWDDILPPGPEDVWRADLAEIARKLATHGGVALV